MDTLTEKEKRFEEIISAYASAAVAFSAGVDSAFLAFFAKKVLRERMIAVTANVPSFPARELDEARAFCRENGIRQLLCEVDQLKLSGFYENPKERCYYCKKAIFTAIKRLAYDNGAECVCEGSNLDDMSDYRPGLKALAELDIKSPLREAGLTKEDIRALSKKYGLRTWDKPSFACLATRIPYGDIITKEKLEMIDLAESRLSFLGFKQYRVRVHGDIARIELPCEDIPRLMDKALRKEINSYLLSLGLSYITLDLGGFKSGNMNKTL